MKKSMKIMLSTLCASMTVGLVMLGSGCSMFKKWTCDHENNDAGIVIKEATCTEEGEILYKCFDCGREKTEKLPIIEHSYNDGVVTKESTCTEKGETLYTCSVCLHEKTAELPLAEHERVLVEFVAPTCTKEGSSEGYKCADCNAWVVKPTVIPALGHSLVVDKAVAATCTENGLTEGSHCIVCDEVVEAQEVVPAKGHTVVTIPGYAATCTEAGLTNGSECSVCGKVYVAQTEIPASGHTYNEEDLHHRCIECGEEELWGELYKYTEEELTQESRVAVVGQYFRLYKPLDGCTALWFDIDGDDFQSSILDFQYSSDGRFTIYHADPGGMVPIWSSNDSSFSGIEFRISDEYVDIYVAGESFEYEDTVLSFEGVVASLSQAIPPTKVVHLVPPETLVTDEDLWTKNY